MKWNQSELGKLRERYLESEYPGDLSEILGTSDSLAPPWQVQPNQVNSCNQSSLLGWSLVAILLISLSIGLIWSLALQSPVTPKLISLSKRQTSKLPTPRGSSLWPSSRTNKLFQKNSAVKTAFLKSPSTSDTQIRLTVLPRLSFSTSNQQLAKNTDQTTSPPNFWKTPNRRKAIFNSARKNAGNGVKKNTRPRRSIFVPQRYKLNPIHPPRRS